MYDVVSAESVAVPVGTSVVKSAEDSVLEKVAEVVVASSGKLVSVEVVPSADEVMVVDTSDVVGKSEEDAVLELVESVEEVVVVMLDDELTKELFKYPAELEMA